MPAIIMEDTKTSLIEEGVPEDHQTMTQEKPFWAFFTANCSITTWVIGVLIIALGLDFWRGIFVVLLGNLIGAAVPALIATMGPKTRLTQMENSRLSFGKDGTRIPSFINWLNCIGWDAVNNVPSAVALVGLAAFFNLPLPYWLGLTVLAIVQIWIGFYGHHMVQIIQKSLGYAVAGIFIIVGIVTVMHTGTSFAVAKEVSFATVFTGFGIILSYVISYAPYASDYTRYLPSNSPVKPIFWRVFLGIFLSSLLLEFFGMLMASAVTDQTPQGVIETIRANTGYFAPLALFVIGFACIPQNAMNDNTGAYSLISSGVKIPRHASAVISALIAFVIAVYGAGQFTTLLENYLFLILYWVFLPGWRLCSWAGSWATTTIAPMQKAGRSARRSFAS